MIKKGKGEGGRRKRYPLKTGMVVLGKTEKGRGKKTKDIRRVAVQRKSFEDTRIQIRNFIEELERKAEEEENGAKTSPSRLPIDSSNNSQRNTQKETTIHSSRTLSEKKSPRTSRGNHSERAVQSERKSIREEYAAMQQSAADEALQSYTKRLEIDMNREIQAQIDHEDVVLKRETDSIEDRFESDVSALREFEESIEIQIRELEVLKRHAREKIQELRICRDRCVDKCKERHRIAIEEMKLQLQNAMNEKVEERQKDIQKKLAAVLMPSVW